MNATYWETIARGATLILALFELTDRERYVVVQRLLRERKLADLADEMGCSRQRISKLEQRGLNKLAALLERDREWLAA